MVHSFILLAAAALPAASGGLPNFAFQSGRLDLWEGNGFYVTTAAGQGPSPTFAVCSSDAGRRGRRAVLHRTLYVPLDAGSIRFTAAAVRAPGCDAGPLLDVVLDTEAGKRVGKQLRGDKGWQASKLLPLQNGRLREYRFPVGDLAGQTVRIAVVDEDDRPGCHVICSGFRFETLDERNSREFAVQMIRLVHDNHLTPVTRFDSRHFMALSNADDGFSEDRLYNCETIYALFFEHFRKKGFEAREPREKLMVAVFDTQVGFEAYLGGKQQSNALRGVYHPPSNCLVVYDYGQNRAFLSEKQLADRRARQLPTNLERERAVNAVNRNAATYRGDANIGTIMHEVAHQLSFNCGLLNREGDVPVWLAEGLACYCESTENGGWQGIGEPNSSRAATLARSQAGLLPLRSLIENDDWIRKTKDMNQIVLGYAQSWALFSMLVEQRPKSLRKYLALIESRRAPDHRLADFAEVFGSDFAKFEAAYLTYVRDVVKQQVRTR
jgi:hypothetical protein